VVFNGEIYNFEELRKQLEEQGHAFCTDHSDTEVIVHLYEEYGDDFVHKINGMFAIALWDSRGERLLLIRDRSGVKPLFYTSVQGHLMFGSEIKAILAHPDYRREINFEAIYHYLTLKNVPSPLTAFRDLYSVLLVRPSPSPKTKFRKGSGGRFGSPMGTRRIRLKCEREYWICWRMPSEFG